MLRWGKTEEARRDELLSAYLDGELSQPERDRLEARLAQDAGLRAELRALREVAFAVRELPQVSAPRNFILTESMVGRREPAPAARPRMAWAAPLLTAATAVVSLLFVVVLAGELLVPGIPDFAAAPAPMRQMEEAAPLVIEEEPVAEEERELPVSPTPREEILPEIAPEEPAPEAELEEDVVGLTAAEATREAEALPEPAEMPVPPAEDDPAVEVESMPLPEAPAVEELDATPPPLPEEEPVVGLARPGLPRTAASVVLGLATLVLGLVTLQAWRMRLG